MLAFNMSKTKILSKDLNFWRSLTIFLPKQKWKDCILFIIFIKIFQFCTIGKSITSLETCLTVYMPHFINIVPFLHSIFKAWPYLNQVIHFQELQYFSVQLSLSPISASLSVIALTTSKSWHLFVSSSIFPKQSNNKKPNCYRDMMYILCISLF